MEQKLKRAQERQLYELIQAKELHISEFSLGTSPSGRPSVVHVSDSYFVFGLTSDGKHSADHVPGVDRARDRVVTGTWEKQVARFELWLDLLREELETPDLWGQLDGVRNLVDSWGVENTAFTKEEQSEIALRFAALESKIEHKFSLTHEELAAVKEGLDYLVGASTRVGRRDWLIMLIGTVLSFGLQALLPRAVAENILGAAWEALSGAFEPDTPELPPGGPGGKPKSL